MFTRTDYETVIKQGLDIKKSGRGVRIIKIQPDSPLLQYNISSGDRIIRINGRTVQDIIDYQFLTAGENHIHLTIIKPDNSQQSFYFNKNENKSLGIELENFKYQHCGNKCIFCFVDQNAPGMRPALYFKDEDYRLSFLWGNFITLSNISPKELNRIVEQRLAPLYISIHATELELRKKLIGIRDNDHLLDKLEFLAKHNIEMHGQIVLCPGFNDGVHIENTCRDLLPYYPALNTLAIVPVGLTKYRDNLSELKPVTADYASRFIQNTELLQLKLSKSGYKNYLFLADEWYLRANKKLPPYNYYGRFPQLENGVGIVRQFQFEFNKVKNKLPARLKKKRIIHLITSVSAAKFMQQIVRQCNRTINLDVRLHPVINYFYGDMITVSGLLTGQDIFLELKNKKLGDLILLPPDCVKEDENIFLDDMTIDELSNKINRDIIVCRDGAAQMVDLLINPYSAIQ